MVYFEIVRSNNDDAKGVWENKRAKLAAFSEWEALLSPL